MNKSKPSADWFNVAAEVEIQVDAYFSPLFALIPARHHEALEILEHDVISAIKTAMRAPATEPRPVDPLGWSFGSGARLARYLTPEQQRELREGKSSR